MPFPRRRHILRGYLPEAFRAETAGQSSSGPSSHQVKASEMSPELAHDSDGSVHSSPGHAAPDNLYYHLVIIPLVVGRPPHPPYPLQICIHPDFGLVNNAVIHLAGDGAYISTNPSIHARPSTRTQLEPLDLYTPCMTHLALSPAPSPPGTPSPPARSPPRPSPPPPLDSDRRRLDGHGPPLDTDPPLLHHGSPPPPDVRHLPVDQRRPSSPHMTLIITVLAALVSFLLGSCPGHPAWVLTSSTNTTIDIPVWQPIHLLYRDYEESVLPLLTRFELSSPILPARPSGILSGYNQELSQISWAVGAWGGSDLPPLDPEMLKVFHEARAQFFYLQHHFRHLYETGDALLRAFSAELLAWGMEISLPRDAVIRSMADFWQDVEKENSDALKALWGIDRSLKYLHLDPVLEYLDNNFRPLLVHPDRSYREETWVHNAIDAIAMIRTHTLPLVDMICPLVSRAIATLSTADSNIAGQLEIWEMAELNNGIWQQDICRFVTDSPQCWSSWVYSYTRETRVWGGVG